jgi:hypothetical protein
MEERDRFITARGGHDTLRHRGHDIAVAYLWLEGSGNLFKCLPSPLFVCTASSYLAHFQLSLPVCGEYTTFRQMSTGSPAMLHVTCLVQRCKRLQLPLMQPYSRTPLRISIDVSVAW